MIRKEWIVGLVILLMGSLGWAHYDYELGHYQSKDFEYRNAAEMDDLIERGPANVSNSPIYRDGVRLIAGGDEEEPGLASAIYYFHVPWWATYLKIKVRYRDISEDNEIAGRLWIKIAEEVREVNQPEEEIFYGDTFVLRADRGSEIFYVPVARYVEDGQVEMHIVAEGKDLLDVKYLQVSYLKKAKVPEVKVIYQDVDNYWHRYPRYRYVYHYYYWGPCYWPRTYFVYDCWDWSWGFSFYWSNWRPWFRVYVGFYYDCYPRWHRRYTVVYDCKDDPPVVIRRRIHKQIKENKLQLRVASHQIERRIEKPQPVSHQTRQIQQRVTGNKPEKELKLIREPIPTQTRIQRTSPKKVPVSRPETRRETRPEARREIKPENRTKQRLERKSDTRRIIRREAEKPQSRQPREINKIVRKPEPRQERQVERPRTQQFRGEKRKSISPEIRSAPRQKVINRSTDSRAMSSRIKPAPARTSSPRSMRNISRNSTK